MIEWETVIVKPVRIARWGWMARCLAGIWLGVLCAQAGGAGVELSVRRTDSSVILAWPSGLGWVQVQRATVLGSGAWVDLGAVTSEGTMQEPLETGVAFYRLRFYGGERNVCQYQRPDGGVPRNGAVQIRNPWSWCCSMARRLNAWCVDTWVC